MSSRRASNQARARVLRSSIKLGSNVDVILSTLRTVIGAALVATVAVDADAGELADRGEPLPDEAREVFQRRRAQRLDLVEVLVIKRHAHVLDGALDQAEIDHHAGFGIGRAAQRHLGAKGVAVDLFAISAESRSRQ